MNIKVFICLQVHKLHLVRLAAIETTLPVDEVVIGEP